MIVDIKNVNKDYIQEKMTVNVLKDINLSVDKGEYIAIMGPSGSGKTTLMNIIGCLDIQTSGEYLLEEQDVSKVNDDKMSEIRNEKIGFVFQQFHLLPKLNAMENVALPLLYRGYEKEERMKLASEALEKVGLGERKKFMPNQLSGGQCQRVAIARAIAGNPILLLADEPTGALDTKSGEQVMELFKKLNDEGATIIMITHEQEIAEHANKIYYIRDGMLRKEK
jgi:putative ABC transport system ATP-binding protein